MNPQHNLKLYRDGTKRNSSLWGRPAKVSRFPFKVMSRIRIPFLIRSRICHTATNPVKMGRKTSSVSDPTKVSNLLQGDALDPDPVPHPEPGFAKMLPTLRRGNEKKLFRRKLPAKVSGSGLISGWWAGSGSISTSGSTSLLPTLRRGNAKKLFSRKLLTACQQKFLL